MEARHMPPTVASDDFVDIQYISVGANRHPASADSTDDMLVFGAGGNIALWNPAVSCFPSLQLQPDLILPQ
jgi:hypothetical protein